MKKVMRLSKKIETHKHKLDYGGYRKERGWGEVEEGKGRINGN